ncbi:hypothetical protein B0J14DRAFT_678606 [Halenospora varia]|nr:hypothetical protein B0J14DRAFT_678606 [Halenospora varia]
MGITKDDSVKTSIVTIYNKTETNNVIAGVGSFKGSNVRPFIQYLQTLVPKYQHQTLPYNYVAVVHNPVVNTAYFVTTSPIDYRPSHIQIDCLSYFLTGGLEMATLWTPPGHQEYSLVKIDDVPSVQMEFTIQPGNDHFLDEDCQIFGIFICANGTDGGIRKSTNPTSRPNFAANVTFFIRKAMVVAAYSNFSIIDISNLSPPALITDLDITAYRAALTWLLNFTAADIPAPFSIAENF